MLRQLRAKSGFGCSVKKPELTESVENCTDFTVFSAQLFIQIFHPQNLHASCVNLDRDSQNFG